MKVRLKNNHNLIGESDSFTGIGAVTVYTKDSLEEIFIHNLEIELKTGEWIDMETAFKNKSIIVDNYDRNFREPETEEEFIRGYYY